MKHGVRRLHESWPEDRDSLVAEAARRLQFAPRTEAAVVELLGSIREQCGRSEASAITAALCMRAVRGNAR